MLAAILILLALVGILYLFGPRGLSARFAALQEKKEPGHPAWDRGTVLQARISYYVGDVDDPSPAKVAVILKGDLKHGPELLLWLVARVLTDSSDLHKGSLFMGLTVPAYLGTFAAKSVGMDLTPGGLGMITRLVDGPDIPSSPPDCTIVANLADGGQSQFPWVAMVHFQGPVGDTAIVSAPLVLMERLEEVCEPAEQKRLKRYLRRLDDLGEIRQRQVVKAAELVTEIIANEQMMFLRSAAAGEHAPL
jgi:hypothetical protein